MVGGDLHDAASTVGHEQIRLAALFVDDHVERAIAIPEFGDRDALEVRTGQQLRDRELDQRGARIGGQNVGLSANVERHEGADRGARFKAPVRPVVDLDVAAGVRLGERERNRPQIRRELFVGQARHEDAVFNEGQVGDGLSATVAATLTTRGGRIGQRRLGESNILQRELLESTVLAHSEQDRDRLRALSAGDGEVGPTGGRVHGKVRDANVTGRGAEQSGDFLADAGDGGKARLALRPIPRINRENRCAPRVGHEEHAVRPKGERAGGLEFRSARLERGRQIRGLEGGRKQQGSDQ